MKTDIKIGKYKDKYYIFRYHDKYQLSDSECLNKDLKWQDDTFNYDSKEEAQQVLDHYNNKYNWYMFPNEIPADNLIVVMVDGKGSYFIVETCHDYFIQKGSGKSYYRNYHPYVRWMIPDKPRTDRLEDLLEASINLLEKYYALSLTANLVEISTEVIKLRDLITEMGRQFEISRRDEYGT